MKRLLVVLLLTLALTGCSVSSKPSDEPSESNSPTSGSGGFYGDAQFADTIKDNTDYFDSGSTKDIVNLADAVCGAFDSGATLEEVGALMIDEGAPPYDAGFFVGASVSYACPEHDDKLDSGTNT